MDVTLVGVSPDATDAQAASIVPESVVIEVGGSEIDGSALSMSVSSYVALAWSLRVSIDAGDDDRLVSSGFGLDPSHQAPEVGVYEDGFFHLPISTEDAEVHHPLAVPPGAGPEPTLPALLIGFMHEVKPSRRPRWW